MVWKLSSVKLFSTSPLSALTAQNAVIRMITSEPRYPMTSQPIGPASSVPTCSRGRPWKRPASLRPTDLLGAGVLTPAASTT